MYIKVSKGVLWLLQDSLSHVTLVPFPYHLDLYMRSICLPACHLNGVFFLKFTIVIVKGHGNIEKSYHVQAPPLLEGFARSSGPASSH